jgi:hypothetical protein
MSPVRYELSFYDPKYGILHIHRRETLKSYRRSPFTIFSYDTCSYKYHKSARCSVVVKALRYKPDGSGFQTP